MRFDDASCPPPATIESALRGAISFAGSYLSAAGLVRVELTRLICTPDARGWTLAFGDHYFSVDIGRDGFSVQPIRTAAPAFAPRMAAS